MFYYINKYDILFVSVTCEVTVYNQDQTILYMKRLFLILLVVCFGIPLSLKGQVLNDSLSQRHKCVSADSLVYYHFVPGVNMFYAQYRENKKNLKDFSEFLFKNLERIKTGEAVVKVEGYCASSGNKKATRTLLKTRSNRVKSYFIEHVGLNEDHFQTINRDTACCQGKNVVRLTYLLTKQTASPAVEELSQVIPPTETPTTAPPTTETPPAEAPTTEMLFQEKNGSAAGSSKVLFALKTNLLYDLALTPNIEVEVPIGRRWSINAEYQYGWWHRKDNTFCWQIEAGGLEGRYWLGNRQERPVLSGWFVGLFAGGGMYDFQLEKDAGYQGEFYIMMGASAGYVKPIGRNLHLEFSAGVGALVTDYRHYHVINDELIKQGLSMKYKAFLPIKAKVSLVWLLHGKNKKGTVR